MDADNLLSLMISISNAQFSGSTDTWVWVEDAAGEFRWLWSSVLFIRPVMSIR
ncbi:hypothetical protein HanRHA438_Chr13g0587771 [Helianthus annuus]|nr:hypothetical protein HanHA300_Chr13g0472891 [Helianthus annuus]KAJ0496870.1 hypothetical protein HanHA89_Chr13g0504781 [Helianthus annuus]KAJ0662901.1 hypothetical protein HanLR1_Chr13g0474921 [Helianthus annuus]KAJ0670410.1 hypothetical protein HanOQP8_Chr13g0473881 [Helianthus annuus]KAJ0857243.1 hypothetical protein HanRHA438_Chr13g0587771 [Helianthus annuus]